MPRALRVTFHEELGQLEEALQDESRLALRSLRAAVNALVRQDVELADEVIAFDNEVDAAYFELEKGVESLLARQTPVATDLRLVLALLHINLHLERMADLCTTIAKLTKLVESTEPDHNLVEGFEEMAARAEEMINLAMEAFRTRDVAKAESLVELDELIDRANRRTVEHVLDLGGDVERREWGLRMLLVSRCLERIGDHAVDIGEQTAYLVTGEFREFTDASHPDARRWLGPPPSQRSPSWRHRRPRTRRRRPDGAERRPARGHRRHRDGGRPRRVVLHGDEPRPDRRRRPRQPRGDAHRPRRVQVLGRQHELLLLPRAALLRAAPAERGVHGDEPRQQPRARLRQGRPGRHGRGRPPGGAADDRPAGRDRVSEGARNARGRARLRAVPVGPEPDRHRRRRGPRPQGRRVGRRRRGEIHAGAEGADHQHVRPGTEWFLGENRGNAVAFAHAVVRAGADLVVGSGPHVLRGIEWYRGRPIAYSLGNFLGYHTLNTEGVTGVSAILQVTLARDGSWVAGDLVPLTLAPAGIPRPDPLGAAQGAVRTLSRQDFGKRAMLVSKAGVLRPPPR